MDDIHDQVTGQPAKISFKDLCLQLGIGDGALDDVDWMADVPAGTFWKMFLGRPVSLKLAEKALFALSEHDGETRWTLNSVEVSLLPTPVSYFVEAFRHCPMDYQTLVALAAHAGITQTVIDCMIVGKPVYRAEAEKVLALLSLHTDRVWSFETTDVLLLPPQAEGLPIPYMALSEREWRKRHEKRIRALKKKLSEKRG